MKKYSNSVKMQRLSIDSRQGRDCAKKLGVTVVPTLIDLEDLNRYQGYKSCVHCVQRITRITRITPSQIKHRYSIATPTPPQKRNELEEDVGLREREKNLRMEKDAEREKNLRMEEDAEREKNLRMEEDAEQEKNLRMEEDAEREKNLRMEDAEREQNLLDQIDEMQKPPYLDQLDPHEKQRQKTESFQKIKATNSVLLEEKARDVATKNTSNDIVSAALKMRQARDLHDSERQRTTINKNEFNAE
jgi:hypothetical protein